MIRGAIQRNWVRATWLTTIVALAVLGAMGSAERAEAKGICSLKGGVVVEQNREVRVSRRLPVGTTRDDGVRVYFFCRYKDGRQRHLVTSDDTLGPFVRHVRVAGRYVGWSQEESLFRDEFFQVTVLNTRTRTKRRSGALFSGCVQDLLLTASGAAVWPQLTSIDCADPEAQTFMWALDPTLRTLVRSPGIDRGSLAVDGRRVSWRVGGVPGTTRLRR